MRLAGIELENFRSLKGRIYVPLDASVVLIHGTNGSGKTSVLSGIELALTGAVEGIPLESLGQLVHHGTEECVVQLHTGAGRTRHALTPGQTPSGAAALDGAASRFFRERCYLAQSRLGRLLELYQATSQHGHSPLTRFVKDLLGLDALDAFIDGLAPVANVLTLRKALPTLASAEHELKAARSRSTRLAEEAKLLEVRLARERSDINAALSALGAPPGSFAEARREWLSSDHDAALNEMLRHRRVLRALRDDLGRVSRGSTDETSGDNDPRLAAETWKSGEGQVLSRTIEELRAGYPHLPTPASVGPARSLAAAVDLVNGQLEQLAAELDSDNDTATALQYAAAQRTRAKKRLAAIEQQLVADETVSELSALSQALASLLPHVHGSNCPVCTRDYSEVSDVPLENKLIERISSLREQASIVQSTVQSRIDAANELEKHSAKEAALVARRLPEARRTYVETELARLHSQAAKLAALGSDAARGDELLRSAAVAAETQRSQAHRESELDRIRTTADSVRQAMGQPAVGSEALSQLVSRLGQMSNSEVARLEAIERQRRSLRDRVDAVEKAENELTAHRQQIEETEKRLRFLDDAVSRAHAARDVAWNARKRAEKTRASIVREVFNESLNSTWRDLFIRLAPDEPFVPAFKIPDGARTLRSAELQTLHRDGTPAGSPGAMLSSGNLNTAALTLFLALHLSAPPDLPWLLLDDPVQSMDEIHVAQLAAVLRTLSHDHGRQIVIAVHERSLFDYLSLELSPATDAHALATVELNRTSDGDTLAVTRRVSYERDHALGQSAGNS